MRIELARKLAIFCRLEMAAHFSLLIHLAILLQSGNVGLRGVRRIFDRRSQLSAQYSGNLFLVITAL